MAENSFRILLDFRGINFKSYKFVWMSVQPRELITIQDLKEAILKKFSLETNNLQLFLRDGILPENENVCSILRDNDSVRLFYSEPSNLNEVKTKNVEETDASSSDDQATSSKKRKTHSNGSINLEENEQVKLNKKRKHSFSNGTCLLENNNTAENIVVLNTPPVGRENISNTSLNNFENSILSPNYKLSKIKKKLKYTNDIARNSENETFIFSDTVPSYEKNESRVNSCKKKKKHKHSKDMCVSTDESILHNEIVKMSKMNENQPKFCEKKKKRKHSHKTVSFSDETDCIVKKSNEPELKKGIESLNIEKSKAKAFEKKESVFDAVTEDSEVFHPVSPVSFCTSSGIGSLESPKENNRNLSPKKSCSQSSVSDSKFVSELQKNNLSGQGNNCKKRKRKRHRKRKSVDPQVDTFNDWDLGASQKIENIDSTFASSSYQTAEISSRSLETPDSSKSNAYLSTRNVSLSDLKKDLLEQFNSHHLSTSTPFSQPFEHSGLKNAVLKSPSTSVVTKVQSCTVAESRNLNKKKTTGNFLPTQSMPCEGAKSKIAVTVASLKLDENHLSYHHSPNKLADTFSNEEASDQCQNPNFSFEGCPPLNSCPLVGTRIAYKVLELDASYCPAVSNYKEGIVKAVNPQTDELEIELIEPEVKEGRSGKFENVYDDELPLSEVIRKVTLSWSSLINPVRVTYEFGQKL